MNKLYAVHIEFKSEKVEPVAAETETEAENLAKQNLNQILDVFGSNEEDFHFRAVELKVVPKGWENYFAVCRDGEIEKTCKEVLDDYMFAKAEEEKAKQIKKELGQLPPPKGGGL